MVTETSSTAAAAPPPPPKKSSINPSVTIDITIPSKLDRVQVFFRIIIIIPIAIILGILLNSAANVSVIGTISIVTALMIIFRKKYPRWWFDFQVELNRFVLRITAYFLLMSNEYPSTDDHQNVDYQLAYPDATKLNRFLPLVKWLLAIPHYIVLWVLGILGLVLLVAHWFYALIAGKPNATIFGYFLGYARYYERVYAYVVLLATDRYPAFSFGR